MPVRVSRDLPVSKDLQDEGLEVIFDGDDFQQNMRPLRLAILNLMPKKQETELQLLRLIGSSPLPVDVDFLHTGSYQSKNVSLEHLDAYYKVLDEVKDDDYDGLIVTGAPIEHLAFDDVTYYDELVDIMEWSTDHVKSRFFICWGAQFALGYYYGIEKVGLPQKLFGIYQYQTIERSNPYVRGFNDSYFVPVSRHTTMDREAIENEPALQVLTTSSTLGPDLITSADQCDLFIFGHLEYDRYTLESEYKRDKGRGKDIAVPKNYYPNDNPDLEPEVTWRSSADLLFNNWMNEMARK